MKKPVNLPIPVIKVLNKLGKDLRDARLRRRITVELMAERAGLSRATILMALMGIFVGIMKVIYNKRKTK